MEITSKIFGRTKDGLSVELFTLKNNKHVTVNITNYGAIISSIVTPDQTGKTDNIICGFDKFENYLHDAYVVNYPYFGCIIGRFGNRIANGKYSIDGVEYSGAVNNGPNHLHGGLIGFDRRIWTPKIIEEVDKVGIKMSYFSPDMEEGYPGNLSVSCTYTLDNANNLSIVYEAETDKTTIVNLTNHTYFNLTGGKEKIMKHDLVLAANKITESEDMIPTGKILPVEKTVFDFTTKKQLGKDIAGLLVNGYDQNYVLDNEEGNLIFAGCLSENKTGRKVKVYTTQPGMQLYTGYWIPELTIEGEKKFGSYSGVALETQHFPDSPNHENFPTTLLRPGEKYLQTTIYQFDTK